MTTCTYSFQTSQGDETIKGMADMKAFLALNGVDAIVANGKPIFSREANSGNSIKKESIQNAVNQLRKVWKNAPEIIVVQDMSDPAIRKAVRDENQRQLSQGAEGQPEGFFDAGKVYIVASEMNSADDVIRVVFHETLGHYGLRGVYGDKLDRVLDSIYMARRQLVLAKATQYGLDFTKQSDRRIAAEEVLAEMAQTNPQAGFVQRAIAAIRQFLRDIGVKLELSDNDIIVNYLLPARNYVVNGSGQNKRPSDVLFNRADVEPTQANLFKTLSGNKVVEAEKLAFDAANKELERENEFEIQDILNDIANGNGGVDIADLAENPKYWDAENEELTDEGYAEYYRLNLEYAKEKVGFSKVESISDLDGLSQEVQTKALEGLFDGYGITYNRDYSYSTSRYFNVEGKNGDSFKVRLANHANTAKGMGEPDYNIAPDVLSFSEAWDLISDRLGINPASTSDFKDGSPTRGMQERQAVRAVDAKASSESLEELAQQGAGVDKRNVLPATILVNGKQRHTINSNGKPIHPTREWVENFWKWFGDSKVVDADGKPLVVYHGTPNGGFSSFSEETKGARTKHSADDVGFHFTDSSEYADSYSEGYKLKAIEQYREMFGEEPAAIKMPAAASVYPVYLNIVNPMYVSASKHINNKLIEQAKALGHDGIIADMGGANEYVAFNQSQIKSAIGNNGDFNPNNPDIRFSRSNPQSSLIPKWDAPTDNKLDDVVYALQDKHIDLKRVSQSIKKAGTDIADRWNAYLQEELYHGRTAKRTQDFIKNDLDPLIEDMRMRGVAMADFEEYLWARHAEERNIQIAKINPDMPDAGSGMSTKDARDYLAGLTAEQKANYQALAKRIDDINRKSRQVLVDYGLESKETIAAWEGAYKNYVPLMREDMDAGFGNGTGQGFSVKGNAAKRATGSNRAVVDVIANIAQQFEKNVIRGEKNRVSTALIGLAELNPNKEFWQVDNPPKIKSVSKTTGLVEEYTDPNYKNRNNVVVARTIGANGKVVERAVVFNQFDKRAMRMAGSIKNLDQDQVGELLGMASSFTRYFASINTQYNPIFGVINIVRDVQGALLNLSTTPIADKKSEVIKNTPSAWLGIYQDLRAARKGGAANSQWADLFEDFQNEGGQTGFRNMYANAQDRSEAIRNALDPLWWQNSTMGKLISANGMLAKPQQWMFEKAVKPIFDWLSDYNTSLENAVRLSVYKVALDNGHSKQQAASMAKNISVNFNRKGEMGRQIGALYAFFNASVQGTARIGETLLSRDDAGRLSLSTSGKRIVQGGLLLGAMQALLLASAGYSDDEPPEFVRDRSLIMPLDMFGADGKYLTLPMPLGFNAIPSLGRILTEWALSGGDKTQERLVHILDMVLNVTNPIGNAGLSLQTIAPTVIDPLAALAENKDFTGRPIAREDFNSLNPTAGFTRSRDKAWDFSVAIARAINWITGGNDYKQGAISPTADQLEYLAGQFTGGVGREIIKAGTTVDSLLTGEDLPTYKIPLVGRFVGDSTGQASQGAEFYANVRTMNEYQNEIKGIASQGGDISAFMADHPEARMARVADLALKQVQNLRKQQRALKEAGDSREQVKMIDERITAIMTRLNENIRELKKTAE